MDVGSRRLAVALVATLALTACASGTSTTEDDQTASTLEPDDLDEAASEQAGADASVPDPEEEADDSDDTVDGDAAESHTVEVAGDWAATDIGSCSDRDGYISTDPDGLTDALIGTLVDQGGARRSDADLGPITKAVLLLEANEGEPPRVRYRIRYGMELRDAPPAADPVPVSFVQIDRFNLGPAIHAELVDSLGEDLVGDLDDFGTGPHVSYCLVMQPLTGMTADVLEASRAEIPDSAAGSIECLGAGSCAATASIPDAAVVWEDAGDPGIRIDAVYDPLRGGVLSPAAAVDLTLVQALVATEDGGLVRWAGFEPREGLEPGQPFVEVVVEIGLGQDDGIDVALREGHVMDHTMEAAWHRISAFPSGIPEDPFVGAASAVEARDAG